MYCLAYSLPLWLLHPRVQHSLLLAILITPSTFLTTALPVVPSHPKKEKYKIGITFYYGVHILKKNKRTPPKSKYNWKCIECIIRNSLFLKDAHLKFTLNEMKKIEGPSKFYVTRPTLHLHHVKLQFLLNHSNLLLCYFLVASIHIHYETVYKLHTDNSRHLQVRCNR